MGGTWKSQDSGLIPSSSAVPPPRCSLAPGKREGPKHQRFHYMAEEADIQKGFGSLPQGNLLSELLPEPALQSRLLCFQAFLGFLPSLAEVLLLEYTGQDAICPQGAVSNPLCRELPVSRELHQSRETQISLSQNPRLEVLSWFVFFIQTQPISPSRLPTLTATSLISR